jgi:hypothetical protein
MRRESALETRAVAWARFRLIIVAKMTGVDGIPDRIFFVPGGIPVIIEFKKKGKRGKKLQEKTQPWYVAELLKAGYKTYFCETWEQFLEIMTCQLNEYPGTPAKSKSTTTKLKR